LTGSTYNYEYFFALNYAASIVYLKFCKLMLGCLCSDGPHSRLH
jgi:hypothetical protein